MTITAYPLTWPDSMPRCRHRNSSKFRATLAGALRNVEDSLRLFAQDSGKKLENLVLSSNVSLGHNRPQDPGVAVWFVWNGMQVCIAVDRYQKPEENLQAIHHIIEARRVELRHGGLEIIKATFRGFQALPSPNSRDWTDILGLSPRATKEQIEAAYRTKAKTAHPDHGGSTEEMAELNQARQQALREIG